ncbi:DMT family transporter [Flaviflexus equikiangi]|uniref:Multidrug efflux SMR transporter n=1 Tax=Flaviflexus equikiangi TaxID=2758573 RepID=A0ABS2TEE4_9ACTO|nr:multidrug efflux SMR transporter [Flaviflexus equikiangi]MBM9433026.1 multidrug efflux SMR transporter [Flaviflexus equikiangi]
MAWTILLISAVFEAIWATALGASEGFSRLVPTIIFLIAIVISMLGLARAMREIPLGTAYAVWTGTGAALTVSYALVTGTEQASLLKIIFLTGIIAAVTGLKLLPVDEPDPV